MNIIKRIKSSYYNNRRDRKYRPVISLFLFALVGTLSYSITYLVMELYVLSAVIFTAFILFIIAIYLFSINKQMLAMLITLVNLTFFVTLSVMYLGIRSNSHFLLFTAIVLFASAEAMKSRVKYIVGFICIVEYILLAHYFGDAQPLAEVPKQFLSAISHLNIIISFGAIIYTTTAYKKSVVENEKILKELNDKNEYMANFDELTGLPNRRYLYAKLDELMVVAADYEQTFVIGILDIDDFKDINDTYGHLCGDLALKSIAKATGKALRKHDVIGRWGGEEFLVILPDTDMENARQIMERVRQMIATTIVECTDSEQPVTVTVGCAQYRQAVTLDELIRNADALLYKGKNAGKNVVVTGD